MIDIPAVLDYAKAINNRSGLIEFKRYFGQAVEIALWMCTHHKRNLWFGEPDFSGRSHLSRAGFLHNAIRAPDQLR